MRRNLTELRADQVETELGDNSIVVQPLGAIEQHGPHLPLNTDVMIANAVATAAVEQVGEEVDAWLLPPLAYTRSNEHAWAPGTIWLRPTTLLAVLDDIGASIAATPARKLVFFNGHGGNTAAVNVANREIRMQSGLMTFQAHPSLPPDHGGASAEEESGMGVHGGADETSLMMHLAGNLVDLAKATRNVPEWMAANQHVRFGGPVSFGWTSDDFGGHIGDPTVATVERGEQLFAAAVDNFCTALREIATFEI